MKIIKENNLVTSADDFGRDPLIQDEFEPGQEEEFSDEDPIGEGEYEDISEESEESEFEEIEDIMLPEFGSVKERLKYSR